MRGVSGGGASSSNRISTSSDATAGVSFRSESLALSPCGGSSSIGRLGTVAGAGATFASLRGSRTRGSRTPGAASI